MNIKVLYMCLYLTEVRHHVERNKKFMLQNRTQTWHASNINNTLTHKH